MQLNTGARVWLWIVFVLNIVGCVLAAIGSLGLLAVAGLGTFIITLISIAINVVLIIGVALMLFNSQKSGFYLMCGCAAVGLVLNLILGTGLIRAIIGAIVCPLITYLFLREQWNEMA